MDLHGGPWKSMEVHGLPWKSMEVHGFSRIFVGFRGFSWIFLDFRGFFVGALKLGANREKQLFTLFGFLPRYFDVIRSLA